MTTPSNYTIAKESKYIADNADGVDDHLVMVDRDLRNLFSVAQKKIDGSRLLSLSNIASTAGVIPFVNLPGNQNAIMQFLFDLTTTTSNLTISGLGFKPNYVMFLAAKNTGEKSFSLGFSNATNGQCVLQNADGLIDGSGGAAIFYSSAGNVQSATISSMNSDGFVLHWVKINNPSGTYYVNYLAVR